MDWVSEWLETRLTIAFIVYERIKFLPRNSSIFMIETKIGCCVLKSLLRVSNAGIMGRITFYGTDFYTLLWFLNTTNRLVLRHKRFRFCHFTEFSLSILEIKIGKNFYCTNILDRILNRLAFLRISKNTFYGCTALFSSYFISHDSKVYIKYITARTFFELFDCHHIFWP